jgi:hypothetical protein
MYQLPCTSYDSSNVAFAIVIYYAFGFAFPFEFLYCTFQISSLSVQSFLLAIMAISYVWVS